MKRFYFLTQSLPSVTGINHDLVAAGIGTNRMSVIGPDTAELERAHLQVPSLWSQTDIIYAGFWGGVIGVAIGVVLGLILMAADPFGLQLNAWAVWITAGFGGAHGAWMGGLVGICRRNHHLLRYLAEVEQGRYLIMIDTDDEDQARRVRRVMSEQHREAQQAGLEENYSPIL